MRIAGRMTRRAMLGGLAMLPTAARADGYPDHPIRVIVPSSPGAAIDSIARIVTPEMGSRLGQAMVVENVDGAGGILGASQIARAPKDGYTIGFTAAGLVINPFFYKVPYDAVRDFTPISLLTSGTAVLAVPAASRYSTLQALLAAARTADGGNSLSFGSPGLGTPLYLATVMLFHQAGVKLLHVPYKSFNQYVVDMLAGRFDVGFLPEDVAMPQLRSGKLRAIAVSTATRPAALPDVPTASEAGVPGYVFNSWFAVDAPAKLPAGVTQRLNEALRGALESAPVRTSLARLGLEPTPTTPEQTAQIIAADFARYGAIARDVGGKAP